MKREKLFKIGLDRIDKVKPIYSNILKNTKKRNTALVRATAHLGIRLNMHGYTHIQNIRSLIKPYILLMDEDDLKNYADCHMKYGTSCEVKNLYGCYSDVFVNVGVLVSGEIDKRKVASSISLLVYDLTRLEKIIANKIEKD